MRSPSNSSRGGPAVKKLWVVLLVALLVGTLTGSVGGLVGATEPRLTTQSIMIPAAAFIPSADTFEYLNNGWLIESAPGAFVAPLHFPVPEVAIRKVTLYAYDHVSTGGQIIDVCVYLARSAPASAAVITQGEVCTFGSSATDPQIFSTTAISPRSVNTAVHGSYLWVVTPDGDTRFYGVKVTYSY
jgi:hypothetical protein